VMMMIAKSSVVFAGYGLA
jgi:hypothetical protein